MPRMGRLTAVFQLLEKSVPYSEAAASAAKVNTTASAKSGDLPLLRFRVSGFGSNCVYPEERGFAK